MKKIVFAFLLMLGVLSLTTSCVSSIYAYDNNEGFDISVVISNGSAHYYNDGRIMYYLYNGWYYYPYYRNHTLYYYRYSTPPRRHFNPNYRFSPQRNDRPFYRQYVPDRRRPNVNNRPGNRPNITHRNNNRPGVSPRPNNRPNINQRPNGNFGGSRNIYNGRNNNFRNRR